MTDPGLSKLIDSYFDLWWHLDPVEATWSGVVEHDHRLGRFGEEEIGEHLAALRSLANAVEDLEVDDLDDEVDRTALLNIIRVSQHRFGTERPHVHNPQLWVSHVVDGLSLLLLRAEQPEATRSRAAAHRLDAIPDLLQTAEETVSECPAVFVDTAIDILEHGGDLVGRVATHLEPEGVEGFDGVCARATDALGGFAGFLRGLDRNGGDGGFAIGEDAFDYRLRFEHALPNTAAEIWSYGLHLVEEIKAGIRAQAHDLDSSVEWTALIDRLREEHPTASEIVPAYAAEVERARGFVVERDLVAVPPGDLDVVETPSYLRPLIPFAAYQPPGMFSKTRSGKFFVSPSPEGNDEEKTEQWLRNHCAHEISLTSLHEGYPGHHLHFLSAERQPRLLRRFMHTPVTCEGWALYCEEMMGEYGFYRTSEELLFQRLAYLWRALRVVLDVGLHTRRVQFDDAVGALVNNVRIDRCSAESEVRRACATPTYQMSYAVGMRELVSLREDYRSAAGADFKLRDFHRDVLHLGGLPISLMRWKMGL